MWGEGQKVFLWRNTYLRASIFPTCTWNIRDRLCRWTARSLFLSLFEDASLCLRSREEGNEFYASFFTPASANPRPWSAEISTRFRSDIPSVAVYFHLFKGLEPRSIYRDSNVFLNVRKIGPRNGGGGQRRERKRR